MTLVELHRCLDGESIWINPDRVECVRQFGANTRLWLAASGAETFIREPVAEVVARLQGLVPLAEEINR